MDLEYSQEYKEFQQQVRQFAKEHGHRSPKSSAVARPDAKVRDWQALLIENGYAARTIPRQYGGYGAEPDILKNVIIAEELNRAGLNRGLSNQGVTMLIPTLLEVGTEEQRQKWIKPTLYGEVMWCQGYSEPSAGSDLAALRTNAVEDGDDFIINGHKIWTSSAQVADMMFILVRTEPDAPKHQGISYLLLSMATPGIEIQPLVSMTGVAEFNEVFFTDVRLKQDQIVGKRGEGWLVANTTLKHERGMLGDPDRTARQLQGLIDCLKNESVNGQPMMEFPVYRDRVLRLQARVKAMQYNSMRVLTCNLRNEDAGVARLIVKLNATILNNEICETAIDLLGETGALFGDSDYVRRKGMWQYAYMYSLGLIIGGGTSQIQKNIIAERGLGMPREPRVKAS
tara:strand:+ start:516 stop:1709 length:1194 start_codon:yes stop_codon:yes gene_type:complete